MYLRIRSLVDRTAAAVAERTIPLIDAGRAVARDPKWRTRLIVIGATCALLTVIAAAGALLRPASAPTHGDDAWQYLVVCDACGQRQRTIARPDSRRPQVCGQCGKGHLTSYRRGSQALVPGGWSTSQPGGVKAQDEEGS